MEENFDVMAPVNINHARNILRAKDEVAWRNELQTVSKLRTYCTFKDTYNPEPFLFKVTDRHHRSVLAQFRCGILPLKIETGRYQSIPPEFRLCVLCEDNVVESESHFMFFCAKYKSLRDDLYNYVISIVPEFLNCNESQKFKILMSEHFVKRTAEYLYKCYNIRQNTIYR